MRATQAVWMVLWALLRIALGALFVFAGAQKIAEPQLLYDDIKAYRFNFVVSFEAGPPGQAEAGEGEVGTVGRLEGRRPLIASEDWLVVPAALAFFLPWLEVIAGSLLLMGSRTRAAGLVIAGMLVFYLLGYWWALAAGLDLSCSCFGDTDPFCSDPEIGACHVVRNAEMLAVAVLAVAVGGGGLSLDGNAGRGRVEEDA